MLKVIEYPPAPKLWCVYDTDTNTVIYGNLSKEECINYANRHSNK